MTTVAALPAAKRPWLSPVNRRRWQNFKANRRGWWSFWIFLVLFVATLLSNVIANDRPLVVSYKGEILFPVLVDYPEEKFGGFLAITNYRDPYNRDEIENNGWMIWPPIRYSFDTSNTEAPTPAPSPPRFPADTRPAMRRLRRRRERQELRLRQHELARHRRSGPRCRRPSALRLPHLGSVRPDAGHRLVDHWCRHRRRAGLLRRLDRPVDAALHRDLERRSDALSPNHRLVGDRPVLPGAASHPARLFMDASRRRRACPNS